MEEAIATSFKVAPKKILASKFAANFLLLSQTAYGFFFRQNPQGYFLPLMGFKSGGRGRRDRKSVV
jgi:hypothetical protein